MANRDENEASGSANTEEKGKNDESQVGNASAVEPMGTTSNAVSKSKVPSLPDLTDDQKRTLLASVKCTLCLVLPQEAQLVHFCTKGHYFCCSCKSKNDVCPTCGENFDDEKNIAVEELLLRKGIELGILSDLPLGKAEIPFRKRTFLCLHGCRNTFTPRKSIDHLRKHHTNEFIEGLKVNPHDSSLEYNLSFNLVKNTKLIRTLHAKDLGVFTIHVHIATDTIVSYVQMLADVKSYSQLRYSIDLLSIPDPISDFSRSYANQDLLLMDYTPVRDIATLNASNIFKLSPGLFSNFDVPNRELKLTACIFDPALKPIPQPIPGTSHVSHVRPA